MSQLDSTRVVWRPGQYCCIALISCLLLILEASCNQDIEPPVATELSPVNGPPVAVFLARSVDCSELFDFDPKMSFDAEDGVEDLHVRWDWEDDGTWDTPWDSVKTVSRRIVDPEQRVRMQVIDGEGATADTVQTLSPPIHTTSVARILAHIGINPCCWLTQPTGCVPCEQHFFEQNYTPGPWSASLHGMTQDSDVAPNWMRMDTSLPSR